MNILRRIKRKLLKLKYNNVLSRISKYKEIEGWLSEGEAFGLYQISSRLRTNCTIVEIGSWKGKSTYCLAKGLKSGKIFAIDPFNATGEPGSIEIYEQTKGNTPLLDQFKNAFNGTNLLRKIHPMVGYSKKFIDHFTEIDLLFIDGDHSIEGCNFDFENFAPKIKRGGYLAFHDYDPNRDDLGPTWVIKNKVLKDNTYVMYAKYDSLWIAMKVK